MLDGNVSGEFTQLVRSQLLSQSVVSCHITMVTKLLLLPQVPDQRIEMRWRFRTWPAGMSSVRMRSSAGSIFRTVSAAAFRDNLTSELYILLSLDQSTMPPSVLSWRTEEVRRS